MSRRKRKRQIEKSMNNQRQAEIRSKRQEAYADKFFSKSGADYKGSLKGTSVSLNNVAVATVKNLFQNPENNYVQIGSYMEALRKKNGIVARTLDYIGSHATFNHSLFFDIGKTGYVAPSLEEYIGASSYLEKYNIKFFAPYFLSQTLMNGMSFFYEVVDSTGVTYIEFPLSMGRISGIENGVYRWMIDISKVKPEMVELQGFPKEIVTGYESTDRTDPKKWVDGKWLLLSNKAVAFCFNQNVLKNGGVAVSDFASLIIDSVQIERTKENVDIKDDIDTVKIIHGLLPMDKDGRPTIDVSEAAVWSKQLNKDLPDGIIAVVNPLELNNINLSGSGNSKAYDTVKDAQSQVFYTTGTAPGVFGADTKSGNIIKISVIKDAAYIYSKVLPVFENYYNEVLRKYKSQSVTWKLRLLRQSFFTLEEDIKRLKDSMTTGGSRTDYLASLGMSPLEVYTKLSLEQQVLDIDSIMVPKPTSFTMTGAETAEGVSGAGRPKSNDPSDDTDRISGES